MKKENRDIMKKENGFTLVELSVVLVIIGVALVAVINAHKIYDEKRKFETTELRLTNVEDALEDFVSVNRRLPCAAPRGVDRAAIEFGREEDCKSAPVGTAMSHGMNGTRVRIGMLPTRTLGISDVYMVDAYGNGLVYAVTESLTDEATYNHNGGGIDVLDSTGTSRLSAVDYAQYVVVSPGSTGVGAYSFTGQLSTPCETDRLESENCDDDSVFVDTDLAQGEVEDFYDDRALYKSRLNVQLPGDTSVCGPEEEFFAHGANHQDCPEGWEEAPNYGSDYRWNYPEVETGTGYNTYAKYYNIDPISGEYYLSQYRTQNSVVGDGDPVSNIGPFDAEQSHHKGCVRSADSNKKQGCYRRQLLKSIDSGTAMSIHKGDRELRNDDCPSGWTVLDVVENELSVMSPEGEGTYGPNFKIRCGKPKSQ